jgi:hypothetical protein
LVVPIDVRSSLNRALKELHGERVRIEKQIAAIGRALSEVGGKVVARGRAAGRRAAGGRRRAMSAAQKKAVSVRMKAYWAKRRGAAK